MDPREIQIYKAIIIAVIVIGLILSYYILSVVKQQKKVLSFQKQNANAVITALEKDRSRIAEDLHDDIAPMLSAIRMKINSFELTEADDNTQLVKINQTIDDLARRVREISFGLMPYSLKAKGLNTAIREFIHYINRSATLSIQLTLPEKSILLNEQSSVSIYRIIQELVHNTIKHAGATELKLELRKENKKLILLVQDNGKGFNYEKHLKSSTGLGLKSLQNRISLLDGELQMESKLNEGSFCTIIIPLKDEQTL